MVSVSPFASHPTQAEKKILVINLQLIYSKAGGAGWSQRVPCCARDVAVTDVNKPIRISSVFFVFVFWMLVAA